MRRPSSDDGEGGLDSLLDTMTNVVGILVIVLVVTQLGVGEAVKRITDSVQIDAEQLAEAQKQLDALQAERDALLAAMSNETPADDLNYEQRMEELRQQIEQQKRVLEQLQAKQLAQEEKLKDKKQRVADAKDREKLIADAKKQVETLSEEWKSKDAKIAEMQALLAETPMPQAPPAKEITLPDPRPAPEGAKQLTIVCSKNLVYLVPPATAIDVIRKTAQAKALGVARKQYRTFKPATGEGVDRFVEEFNQRPLRDESFEYFDIELYNSNTSPRLKFVPREARGEDERAVKGNRSRFQQALRTVNPNLYYIRFYVCSDSFDIYVTTRRIVSDMGLLAGWEPQSNNWTYTTHLGGELRFGPPPKPTPPKPGVKPPTRPPSVID